MTTPSLLRRVVIGPILVTGVTASLTIGFFVWRAERSRSSKIDPRPVTASVASPIAPTADEIDSAQTTHFLLNRVKRDPEDFLAQNMLAGMMLQKVRETGNADYLEAALRASASSLASVPAERNAGGLGSRARAEMAVHDFVAARSDAELLTKLHPENAGSWGVLADTLLELGEYAKADSAIQELRKLGSDTAETEIRLGRLLFLQGDTANAQRHFFRALAFAQNVAATPHETIAWCQWQLGEMAFSTADFETAESNYRKALVTYPGYVQALASLGRLQAGSGDLREAVQSYEQAVRRFPDPTFIAALGDLYHLVGRDKDAQTQYALVEEIGHLNTLNGSRYNRQLALFHADHGRNVAAAFKDATREYQDRRDIYGADAVAWTALKAGKASDAQHAISSALRLSTHDSRLYYHAGMIAKACGDAQAAKDYLRRALKLNPRFDPLQAAEAKKTLDLI